MDMLREAIERRVRAEAVWQERARAEEQRRRDLAAHCRQLSEIKARLQQAARSRARR